MPELPDLAVVVDAFHAALAGRTLVAIERVAPLAVRGTPAELAAIEGRRLTGIRRRGKFVRFELSDDAIVVNAMLTGRFQLADPGQRRPGSTAVVLRFGPRDRGPSDAAAWTTGAPWLPRDDGSAEVRYRDPTQMGKVYVAVRPAPRAIPGLDADQGPDADDPALTLETWRQRIRRHPGELKSVLRNQAFVAGIGNAYSDEILHAARLSPFRKRSSLAAEEVDGLYAAMRSTLADAVGLLRGAVPPAFETQVRDRLAVHRRGGEACPRCGARLSEISSRSEATTWCRICQP